jgi:hypothetical protein
MAGASIGKASLLLGATWTKLEDGLDQAYGKIKGWKSKVGGLFSSGTGKLAAGATIAGGLAGIASASAIAVKALERIDETAQMGKAAKSMGMTAAAATGLFGALKAIGGDFKEDLEGLTQFAAKVQAAFADPTKGEGAKLFEGLSISAKDIIRLPLAEQFYRVHAAIRQLPQDMQMVKLSMVGGTDSMKKWLPLLAISSDEFRKLAAAASVSNEKVAAAEQASDAVKRATMTMDAAWGQVAISLAPVVEILADRIPGAVEAVKPAITAFSEYAVPVFHGVSYAAAAAWDVIRSGTAIAIGVAGGIGNAFGHVIATLGKAIAKLQEFLKRIDPSATAGALIDGAGLEQFGDDLVAESKIIMRKAKNAIGFNTANSVDKFFAEIEGGGKPKPKDVPKPKDAPKPPEPPAKKDEPKLAANVERAANQFAAAMERGSKEEYQTRIRFEAGGVSAARQQLAEQMKGNQTLVKIHTGIDKLNAKKPAAQVGVI